MTEASWRATGHTMPQDTRFYNLEEARQDAVFLAFGEHVPTDPLLMEFGPQEE